MSRRSPARTVVPLSAAGTPPGLPPRLPWAPPAKQTDTSGSQSRRSGSGRIRLLAAVWLGIVAGLAGRRGEAAQEPQRLETSIQKNISIPYLLFRPQGYEAGGAKRWPLIVFLHGAGERGSDLQKVTVHGPPKLVKDRPDFPFVVASPQCPEGATWQPDALDALLDDLLARHSVDPDRVYLTGLSMGGYGTWAWAAARPERFAAIAPICGGGDSIQVRLAGGARREALARLPIWVFHGGKDQVVPPAESERMVSAYQGLGNMPKLTVYPEAGHDSWTAAYTGNQLFDWFLQHRRR